MLTLSDQEVSDLVAAIKLSNDFDYDCHGSAIEISRNLAIKLGMKPGDNGFQCTEEERIALMNQEERDWYYKSVTEANRLAEDRERARLCQRDPLMAVELLRGEWNQ